MHLFVATISLFGIVYMTLVPVVASAETKSATNQIKLTATILPARYVIVDAEGKVLQIISNTVNLEIEPTVYREAIRPENIVPVTPELVANIDKLLVGKTIKPGVLYDYHTGLIRAPETSPNNHSSNNWLSGIFNLKKLNSTVNLTKL